MKALMAIAIATLFLTLADVASAQSGGMMSGRDGGMMDDGRMCGYGGFWWPVLLAVVVGLIVWAVMRTRK